MTTMNLIVLFVGLVAAFIVIGLVAVALQKNESQQIDDSSEDEYSSHIVISQEVPSVFDSLGEKNRRK